MIKKVIVQFKRLLLNSEGVDPVLKSLKNIKKAKRQLKAIREDQR